MAICILSWDSDLLLTKQWNVREHSPTISESQSVLAISYGPCYGARFWVLLDYVELPR